VATPWSSAFSIQALTLNLASVSAKAVPHEIKWSKPPLQQYKRDVGAVIFHHGGGAASTVIGRLTPDAATRETMAFRHVSSGVGKYWMHTCDRGVLEHLQPSSRRGPR
jgi:hypothetical protein